MAVITSGKIFSNGEQLTADKMNQMFTSASFDTAGAIDPLTMQVLTNGSLSVKDGAITPAKISTGGPSWNTAGRLVIDGLGVNGGIVASANNNYLQITGGYQKDSGAYDGARLVLVGSERDSIPSEFLVDAKSSRFRSENGGAEIVKFSEAGDRGAYFNQTPIIMGATSTDRGGGNICSTGTGALVASWDRGTSQDNATTLKNANNVDHLWYSDSNSGSTLGTWNFCADTTYRATGNADCRARVFTTSSDYRLKEDIVEMEDSIDKLKKLKPVNFAWIESGERQDGFIAHEVDEVVPVAVNGVKDAVNSEGKPSYQGVDNGKLVPLLTKCLQEALVKIENLEAKFAALES